MGNKQKTSRIIQKFPENTHFLAAAVWWGGGGGGGSNIRERTSNACQGNGNGTSTIVTVPIHDPPTSIHEKREEVDCNPFVFGMDNISISKDWSKNYLVTTVTFSFEWEKEVRNSLFDFDFPTPVVAFLFLCVYMYILYIWIWFGLVWL